MKTRWLILTVAVLISLAGCAPAPDSAPAPLESNTLQVTVSIPPQKYFVERIGGERVTVNVMVEPGSDPHTYEPSPAQMKLLANSQVYFAVGVDFEQSWLERFQGANPQMRVVNTIEGLDLMEMAAHAHEGEEHEDEDETHESELDTHTWTSPEMVLRQAEKIYQTLAEADSAHASEYQANYEAFSIEISALQDEIRQTLEGVSSRKFLVFHPAWGYFAREFGLEQIAVEAGGQEPSAQELAAIVNEAKAENIRVVFAQPELSTRSAEVIAAEIGGEVLLISPLEENWMENMRKVAGVFEEVLK